MLNEQVLCNKMCPMKTTFQTSAVKSFKQKTFIVSAPMLSLVVVLMLLSGLAHAGSMTRAHKHKKSKFHAVHQTTRGGSSISYTTPQIYTAGKTITPLTPVSANI